MTHFQNNLLIAADFNTLPVFTAGTRAAITGMDFLKALLSKEFPIPVTLGGETSMVIWRPIILVSRNKFQGRMRILVVYLCCSKASRSNVTHR
jgi:hypothetical protein